MKILNPAEIYVAPDWIENEKVREITEKYQAIAEEILSIAKAQIVVKMRFLDRALFELKPMANSEYPLASDGQHLIYEPKYLLKGYRQSQSFALRALTHMLMHCLFRHMFIPYTIDQELWDLCCDLAAESMVCELQIRQLQDAPGQMERNRILDELKPKVKTITAEKLMRYYQQNPPDAATLQQLRDLFTVDTHTLWYIEPEPEPESGSGESSTGSENSGTSSPSSGPPPTPPPQEDEDDEDADGENGGGDKAETDQDDEDGSGNANSGQSDEDDSDTDAGQSANAGASQSQMDFYQSQIHELEEMWRDISEHVQTDLETFAKQQGITAGGMEQALRSLNRERYDYTAFLRKFATMHEVMHLSLDEFDYVYYTYGLSLYRDMPLIEPLEYREDKRIRDFVIALDTSGSVRGSIVQAFLQKTYNILMQEETYDRRFNIHIIQCDMQIQEDAVIRSREDFENYIKTMRLHGFGGTDFRPVFEYVERLRAAHQFTNLKGLLYFTDGYGIFPSKQTDYETAFVFLDIDSDGQRFVPPWAIRIILETDSLEQP